ncbi:hypothetical protein [Pseudomonas sp.]|uniref:hypothetical protein n=1 Tax=Pseudomonas sp. TaxID=306 RepID=UPI003D09FBF9
MRPDSKRHARFLLLVLGASLPFAAHAYVGPGAGLGLLAALWGLVAAVGVAVFYVVMWPIRRMRRQRKAERSAAAARADSPVVQARQAPADPAGTPAERAKDTDSVRP